MERLSTRRCLSASMSTNSAALMYIAIAIILITLSGCDTSRTASRNFIDGAAWNPATATLEVNGHAKGDGTRIDIINAQTKQTVGSTMVTNQHYWKFQSQSPETVPCRLEIQSGGKSQIVDVKNSPSNCNSTGPRRRGLPTVNSLVTVGARPVAQPNLPDGRIITPARDLTISPGTAVTFSAIAASPASSGAVQYLWNFEGAAPNSTTQNPGDIVFNVPGVYHVTLMVANNAGVDVTPATRVISVTAPISNIPAGNALLTAPIANIDTPVGTQFIQVGDAVFFSGSGFDPTGNINTTLQFLWDFQSAAPSSTLQAPGAITFTKPGLFIVSLVVTDSAGNRSLNNPTVTVVVGNQIAANLPPVGAILAPPADMTVLVGTTLFFQGSGSDPDANVPLQYAWDFVGAAPNSNQQNPGMIPFLTPGTYNIKLTVTDSQGLADVNPPVRVITVIPTGGAIANNDFPNGTIVTPAGDITITAGDAVTFVGQGTTPNPANNPLVFMWDFGDPSIPFELADVPPAPIVFANPGLFTVTFNVADALGQIDPTPAQVIVSVLDPAAGGAAPPPPGGGPVGPGGPMQVDGDISAPMGPNPTFAPGEMVGFVGSAEGGTPPYMFTWNFGDPAIPDVEGESAMVAFPAPGQYTVTLNVVDSTGMADPNPPQKVITVGDGGAIDPPPPGGGAVPFVPPGGGAAVDPSAPVAIITSPDANITIEVGSSIEVLGDGVDPTGLPLAFFWDIDSAGTSTVQNPGMVTFTRIGTQQISLTVVNASGLRGQTSVLVNVIEPGSGAPPP